MRIAFVVNGFPALSETFILDQVTGLIDRGHEIDIYASERSREPVAHEAVSRYGLLERTRFQPSMPGGYLLRVLKGLALAPLTYWRTPTAFPRALNVFRYGRTAASLRLVYGGVPFLRGPEHDLIYCHYGWNGLKCVMLRDMGLLRGKIMTAFYGADVSEHVRTFGEGVYRELFAGGDLFLPLSQCMRRRLIELGCDESRIQVHHTGIDPARLAFTPRRPRADGGVKILTIARLVEKKGIEFGIRAVAKLAAQGHKIEYGIIGDGLLRESLQGLIDELDLGDRVRMLGWKRRAEVVDILEGAQILLAPSVTSADGDEEGTPIVLMMALASGMPVVSSRHSGIPELVEDGVSGFLVPERDIDALAGKLAYLVAHPEDWPRFGRAGRAAMVAEHDINKLNDALAETCARLIGDGDDARGAHGGRGRGGGTDGP
ncbi:MAG: glycosyltransferase [Planctomycetota bacterium]|jgi:colanic acid/amylovoran biosynthesis glycosyltransferase